MDSAAYRRSFPRSATRFSENPSRPPPPSPVRQAESNDQADCAQDPRGARARTQMPESLGRPVSLSLHVGDCRQILSGIKIWVNDFLDGSPVQDRKHHMRQGLTANLHERYKIWRGGAGLAGHPDLRDQHAEDQVGEAVLVGGVGNSAHGWVSRSLQALRVKETLGA